MDLDFILLLVWYNFVTYYSKKIRPYLIQVPFLLRLILSIAFFSFHFYFFYNCLSFIVILSVLKSWNFLFFFSLFFVELFIIFLFFIFLSFFILKKMKTIFVIKKRKVKKF